jgi:DNA-binding CsgD family transcriptional regulator
MLDALLRDALAGRSRVLILRGEAGIGKSALLAHLSDRLEGWRIAQAVGVESEMELPYSGLHQICAPMLDQLGRLPDPQRQALSIVFGLSSGPAPDQFLVGLATLTLLAEVAEEEPVAVLVDDAHWLDRASEQILAFVARRLLAERIAIVSAARTGIGDDIFAGLPELQVAGLADGDARALLLASVPGPLDAVVCDQIVAESHGNPLALLELPRSGDLAGGYALPGLHPVVGKIEQSYTRRLEILPSDTRLVVLAAAAEPRGDPALLQRAVATLGIDMTAVNRAVDADLITIDTRVEFAHPLVRSTAYRMATADDRRRVHRALADATDPETDPDHRAWHRAHATSGPDEDVAAALEQSAGRAEARGGVAAASAFLERAVALTADPVQRAGRTIDAAEARFRTGAFDTTLALLTEAEAGPLDEFHRARADVLRGQIAFASGFREDAPRLLLNAARRLEPLDLGLARETYLAAYRAATYARARAARDVLLAVCRSILALPRRPGAPAALDLVLEGLALQAVEGLAAAVPTFRRAIEALLDLPANDVIRWGWVADSAGGFLLDFESTYRMKTRHVQLVRQTGALAALPLHLAPLAITCARMGDFAGAASLIAESESVSAATGIRFDPANALRLSALQGRPETIALIAAADAESKTGEGSYMVVRARWAAAVLYNGLGRYDKAVVAARAAASDGSQPRPSPYALIELVEAAARLGDLELAQDALERLEEVTGPCANDFAVGIEARSRALLSGGPDADDLYGSAIEHLSRAPLRPEVARAHLLYGEWLRRETRRTEAREQLRIAHEMSVSIGMAAFAERARRELVATGEKIRKRGDETRGQLTPQEEQIARLARSGLSNPEIGVQLFLSSRTIEWHLRHVYMKLGIRSRMQLQTALPADMLARAG